MCRQHFLWLWSICLLASFTACSETDKYSLTPHDFVVLLQEQPGQLLDVRTGKEWEKEHLSGALHLPVENEEAFKRSMNRLSRRQVYYLYCQNGVTSAKALQFMREAGFSQVYQLRGGLQSFQQAGYSVAGL